ncbi:MAG: hypothetical protein IJ863_05760 [Spirochaetales bacterium]|nr:hypothetical protein [Spirochaetales bacterium]
MKKAVLLVLVALVAVSSAFAFEFRSIGLETGTGFYASVDMEIIDNLDVYARVGTNGYFSFSVGAQYKVYDFEVQGTTIDIRPGAQMNFSFGDNVFDFSFLGTCQFSFETGNFGAFVRPLIGVDVYHWSYRYGGEKYSDTDTNFAIGIETGVYYRF